MAESKKKVLIICLNDYTRQPRVLRTISALTDHYDISVSGYSAAMRHQVHFLPFSRLEDNSVKYWHFEKPFYLRWPVSAYFRLVSLVQKLFSSYYERKYWQPSLLQTSRDLESFRWDLVIAHGYDSLPLAVKVARGNPVIFNAHEYYPLEFEQDPDWNKNTKPMVDYVLKTYLPRCKMMFCVSNHIGEMYNKKYKIRSTTITNAPAYAELQPVITKDKVKLIHHGAAMKGRQIELMLDMVQFLDQQFELYMMLTPAEPQYLEQLKNKYGNIGRINFVTPVAVDQIVKTINQYDIGVFILPPVNFNWKFALPNKIFEFVQGRLAVAVSPNPDMKDFVTKNEVGIVADDYSPQGMARLLNGLTARQIMSYKENAHRVAHQLNAEHNYRKIRLEVQTVLEQCAA